MSNQSIGDRTAEFLYELWDWDDPPEAAIDNSIGDRTAEFLNASWDPNHPAEPEHDFEDEDLDNFGDETLELLNEDWDGEPVQVGGAGGAAPNFRMSPLFEQAVRRMNTIGRAFRITFTNLEHLADAHTFFINVLEEILDRAFGEANDNDLVGLEILHPGLDTPIIVRFRARDQLSAEVIWSIIEKALQSNEDFKLDEDLIIQAVIIANPQGAGPGQWERKKTRYNLDDWIQNKRDAKGSCVLSIANSDNLCLARAIVTGIARHERILNSAKKKEWEAIRKGDKSRHTRQQVNAQQLMTKAGLGQHRGGCGHEQYDALQTAISPRFRLRVTDSQCMLSVVFCGGTQGEFVDVLLHNGHFDLITSMPAFFGGSYYCEFCKTAYNNRDQHTLCGHRCPCCFVQVPCVRTPDYFLNCDKCHRWFVHQVCFDNHALLTTHAVAKDGKKARVETSVCSTVERCEGCGKTLHIGRKSDDKNHECGMNECRICKETVDLEDHQCYMQPIEEQQTKKKREKPPTSYICYDMETTQDEEYGQNKEGVIYRHKVNCVCMRKVCDVCVNEPASFHCKNCAVRKKTWLGDNALDAFCRWLFSSVNKGSVALAHNASGFDGQFILDYLHKQAIPPEIIMRGLSIISLTACDITLLDSMSFIPMALASMPKAFDIPGSKGYFPHFFNVKDNWLYDGPIPDAWYYGPGGMKPEARDAFYEWYNQQSKTDNYNLQVELVRYCEMDVEILQSGCMKFRQLLLDLFNVDPFTVASTIPGTCMHIYRKKFMAPQSLAIVPHGGYRRNDKHSVIAIKWIKHVSETEGLDIQHAENGGEVRIGRWKVDGHVRGTNQLMEFNGCVYHGCLRCFPNRANLLPRTGLTASDAYQSTMDRQRDLETRGYTVRVMWECELDRLLKSDKTMAAYFKNVPIHEPLDPRHAFFGGRTNAIKLYHKAKEGEKMYYMDVCSLYPWVCKYSEFPIGHPTIITENFKPITATEEPYKGLIKCLVLPPRRLYHPILPIRSGGKLVFPLCKPCANERNQHKCPHADRDRQFWGTWTHVEVYKAAQLGYQVLEIAEVYHWDIWEQHTSDDPESGLFTRYINTFLQLKQQASGWPRWAVTEEQKAQYIKEYFEKEGVQLDQEKIVKNPALRSLAKLALNSFWGKFGQRCTLSKTEYFTDPDEFYNCVFDAANEVCSVRIVNSNMVYVTYEKVCEYIEEQNHTNPIIAAFVTAHARLKLLSYLLPLGRNVMYFDTDSVIFVHRQGEYLPSTGDFLGDLTDELDGDYITEFVSGGPKVYAYRTSKGNVAVKLRGVTLNATTSKTLNFRSLKKHVLKFLTSGDRGHTDVIMNRIARMPDKSVVTKTMRKKYQVAYDKRRVLKSGYTLPYGY